MHLNGVIEAAGWWSYAVVFVLTASETSAFIGLLVPGETAILLAAAVAGRGELNAFLLTAVVVAGAVTGDGLGYALGRRCARRFGLPRTPGASTGHRTARARAFLAHHGGATVITSKFIGFARTFVPYAAGRPLGDGREQDDVADSLGAGRLQQGDGARLGVEEEARSPGELGRGVLRPEPHHLGLLRE